MAQTTDRRINLYINGKQVKNNIKSIAGEYKKTKNELSKLTRGTDEYNKKAAEVRRLKGILNEHNQNIGSVRSSWGKAKDMVKNFVGAGLGIGAVVGGVRKLFSATKEYTDIQSKAAALTGQTGKELDKITKKVHTLSKAYKQDYNKVLESTNTFAREMGVSHSEALGIIEKGFEKGAGASDEYLSILKEYPSQLKAAGLGAEESIAIITQQIQEGIFSDKGIDAIKEATVRIREMTPATKKAMEGIGLSAEQIQEDLRSGSTTYFEVIQKVSDKLNTLEDQSPEVGTAIADIFGGPGEDAGLRYLKMLGDMNTELDSVESKLSAWQRAKANITKAIQSRFTPALKDMTKWMTRHVNNIANFLDKSKTEQQRLRETREEFNKDIRVLKTANFNQEQRAKFIGMINEKYKEYLPNLIDEKASLKEINKIQESVNKQMMSKIIYMDYEEELKKIYEEQKESAEALFNVKKAEAELNNKTQSGPWGSMIEKQKEQLEALEGLNKHVIDSTEKRVDKLQAKYKEIAQNMGLIWDEIQKQFAGGMDSGPKPKDPTGSEEVVNRATQNFDELKGIVEGLKEETGMAMEEMNKLDKEGLQRVINRTDELKKKWESKRDIFGMTPEDWEDLVQDVQMAISMTRSLGDIWSNVIEQQKRQNEQELQEFKENQEDKKEALERRLDAGIISEKEYNQRQEQMEENLEKKKRKLQNETAKQEKQLAYFNAVVNAAEAITQIWAKHAANPILAAALTAVATASTAAQIAAIESQPVPQYEEGGRVKKNQVIEVAEGNKEEGILSNKTLRDPETGPMANYLLDKQAGISTTMPDNGAIDQATDYNNYKRNGGGYSTTTQNVTNNNYNNTDQELKNTVKDAAQKIGRLEKHLSDPNNRRAYISSDIQKEHEEEQQILNEINTAK